MKVSVDVKEVWTHTVLVEVPNGATREQVVEATNKKLEAGGDENTEYSHTMDDDTWTITLPDGNFMG